jgi:hypothetical protein
MVSMVCLLRAEGKDLGGGGRVRHSFQMLSDDKGEHGLSPQSRREGSGQRRHRVRHREKTSHQTHVKRTLSGEHR